MKPSGPKIIIKPRLPKGRTDNDGDHFMREQYPQHFSPHPDHDDPRDDDVTESVDEDHVDGEGDGEDIGYEADGTIGVGTPSSRGRGRPRGRGRGLTTGAGPGTPRARGRPRGTGRGRGRGRGSRGAVAIGSPLTIRLPKRGDEDGAAEVEAGEVAEEGVTEEPVEEEKEVPLGGGKPFRKIQGKVYIIENDEFVTDDDPKGDIKIDKQGNLLSGRRFKATTFALPNRHPERVYMLAIDAARTSGFRDSLYYFRRNLLALKLNATQPEKEYLIAAGKLGSHLRTRNVTLITARSAYKLHGAKMIADGKWVDDDYFEEKSLEEITARGLKAGDLVGELPDPQLYSSEAAALAAAAKAAAAGQSKPDRTGALGMYRAGGPTTIFGGSGWGPYSDGPLNAVRKSMLNRDGLNEENWMLVAAQRTVEAGKEWAAIRQEALKVVGGVLEGGAEVKGEKREAEAVAENGKKRKARKATDDLPLGLYEPHGGIVHYRADTQPTRSRWEVVPDSAEKRMVLGGTKTGNGAWALAWVDTVMELSQEGVRGAERDIVMRTSEVS